MIRAAILALVAGLTLTSTSSAQTSGYKFQWQTGQILSYRVEQAMSAAEVIDGKRTETTSKINLVKRWQVLAVDAGGTATIQKSLSAMRYETKLSNGDTLLFDSANLDKSTPQMREQMAKYVESPLAVLRVNPFGQVVEVKETKFGSAAQFEVELPFLLVFANGLSKVGQAWERPYAITLEPPQGTGEKYEAVQRFSLADVKDNLATVKFVSTLKAPPQDLTAQEPLVQKLPEGEVVFDLQMGRVQSATLKVDKELKNHQGEGTSYQYKSVYMEQWVPNN